MSLVDRSGRRRCRFWFFTDTMTPHFGQGTSTTLVSAAERARLTPFLHLPGASCPRQPCGRIPLVVVDPLSPQHRAARDQSCPPRHDRLPQIGRRPENRSERCCAVPPADGLPTNVA